MLENVFRTIVKGSNTGFLHMPTDEYFFNYPSLNENNAQKLVEQYFDYKWKAIRFKVKDIDIDDSMRNIKIMVEIS